MWSSSLFLCLLFIMAMPSAALSSSPSLQVGFYNRTCPVAEIIVRNVVNKAITRDPGLGAGLIRMLFHDCFVRGCDGSILLDSTPENPTEKDSFINNPSVRGYEIIDEAKVELEAQCPQTVSCADIIAFAARDSAYQLGGINNPVPAGRRDGLMSHKDEPIKNLPGPLFSLQTLELFFATKGLSLEDMVTLSGAHSIGVSHCSSLISRLYPSNDTNPKDSSMDANLANMLRSKCPNTNASANGDEQTVFEDLVTPHKLDNNYYHNVLNKRALFMSDQNLMNSPKTANMVKKFARHDEDWAVKFAAAMTKMSFIEVLTGSKGEIRRSCRSIN